MQLSACYILCMYFCYYFLSVWVCLFNFFALCFCFPYCGYSYRESNWRYTELFSWTSWYMILFISKYATTIFVFFSSTTDDDIDASKKVRQMKMKEVRYDHTQTHRIFHILSYLFFCTLCVVLSICFRLLYYCIEDKFVKRDIIGHLHSYQRFYCLCFSSLLFHVFKKYIYYYCYYFSDLYEIYMIILISKK